MLLLIRNLIKSVVAISNRALERLLTCVDSHVIKKIMPFFKQLFASKIILFAEKGALCSLCMSIVKLYLSEMPCRRDMQTTIKFLKVDICTRSDNELEILWLIELLSNSFNNF
jgi:hypothetical protein